MNRRYAFRRFTQVVVTVGVVLVLAFLMTQAIPGDTAEALAGDGATPAQIADIRHELGLDRSIAGQFSSYASQTLSGDLGTSYIHHVPVWDMIRVRLGATLLLTATALVISIVIGIGLGAAAARRPFGWADLGMNSAALVGYALPVFWLAQVAVLTFALGLDLLPVQGMTTAGTDVSGLERWLDIGRHLVLPATVLAVSEIALLTRITRTGLLGELGRDYTRTARAKGLEDPAVLRRHALPNALLPVVTVIGGRIGFLVSGTVLVENVFAWPGLGRLLVDSAQSRDYPVVLGMVLIVTAAIVVANLLTDLAYAVIDPRVEYR